MKNSNEYQRELAGARYAVPPSLAEILRTGRTPAFVSRDENPAHAVKRRELYRKLGARGRPSGHYLR